MTPEQQAALNYGPAVLERDGRLANNRALRKERDFVAETTFQTTMAAIVVTYGRPGFQTAANYAAYDAAVKAAQVARDAAIASNAATYVPI
jgi:hypothetical protein